MKKDGNKVKTITYYQGSQIVKQEIIKFGTSKRKSNPEKTPPPSKKRPLKMSKLRTGPN